MDLSKLWSYDRPPRGTAFKQFNYLEPEIIQNFKYHPPMGQGRLSSGQYALPMWFVLDFLGGVCICWKVVRECVSPKITQICVSQYMWKKIIQTILKCPKKAFSNWFHVFDFTTADVWWSIDRRQFKTCLIVVIPISFQTSVTQWRTGDRRYMQAANVFAGPANRSNTDHPQKVTTLCPLSFRLLSPSILTLFIKQSTSSVDSK